MKIFHLFWISLFFIGGLLGQSLDKIDSLLIHYSKTQDYKLALDLSLKAIEKYEGVDSLRQRYELAAIKNLRLLRFLDDAEQKGITLQNQLKPKSEIYYELLRELIEIYKNSGQKTKMFETHEQLLKDLELHYGKEHETYIEAMQHGADLNSDLLQFNKAILILQATLDLQKKAGKENTFDYANSLSQQASVYSMLHNDEEAKKIYFQAIDIYTVKEETDSKEYRETLINLAVTHEKLGDMKAAEKLLLQANRNCNNDLDCVDGIFVLGLYYIGTGEYNKSEQALKDVLRIRKQFQGDRHPETALAYINLADLYRRQGKFEAAEAYIKLSFCANSPSLKRISLQADSLEPVIQAHPFIKSFFVATSLSMLDKVYASWYVETRDLEVLERKHENMQVYARYIEKITPTFYADEDKLWVVEISNDEFSRGVYTAYHLHRITHQKSVLEDVFQYFERNKAALLSYTMKSNHALKFGELPDSLLTLERELQIEKDLAKKQMQDAEVQGKSEEALGHRERLLAKEEAMKQLVRKLEANYPKYYNFKYQNSTITTKEVQALLPNKETALISYYLWKGAAFAMVLTKNKVQLVKLPKLLHEMKPTIDSLRIALSDYDGLKNDAELAYHQFVKNSTEVYRFLLAPVFDSLRTTQKELKQLIIVPDNILGQIPFEVLLTDPIGTEQKSYVDLPYLLKKYKISYTYSASLLAENYKNRSKNATKEMFALAASYGEGTTKNIARGTRKNQLRKVLQDLPAAKEEVEGLEKMFAGNFLYNNGANEKNFVAQASEYKIIHLAMHGLLNEKFPLLSSLAFTENGDSLADNFLEAHEISHLNLNAQLVVLSACETGYGKFQQGEGVMSLARSFMYAGVPSLVVSMWQVNDASTSLIMQDFYQNLAKGMDKAEALQQAKLNYIAKAEGMAAHPAFWAPFIQLGDSRPISVALRSSEMSLWWLGLGLAVVVGAGVTAMAMRKRKNR